MTSVTTNMMTMRPMATPAMAAISTRARLAAAQVRNRDHGLPQRWDVHAGGAVDARSRYSRRVRRR